MEYYNDMLLSGEIDQGKNLIVYVRPDIDFEAAVSHLRDSILDAVDFEEHLDVYIYPFGSNEFITLGIN
ncbi:hypothetical protein ACHMWN_08695 [Pedobacter sp. UC225_61]